MSEMLVALASALWLGILTSISPCPLATNVAAISFISREAVRPPAVVLSGLLYTLGRAAAYVVIAALLVAAVLSAPSLSHALQTHMNRIVGPLLVLVGMILLGLIRLPAWGMGGKGMPERAAGRGRWGALMLGFLFALSFCPVSAAIFFGSLLPLAVAAESRVVLPSAYGVGTAIPVIAFAFVISLGARRLGRAFERTVAVERWMRRITGAVFIMVGIYLTLENVFGVFG